MDSRKIRGNRGNQEYGEKVERKVQDKGKVMGRVDRKDLKGGKRKIW
jgi:hypothetical protein